MLTMRQNKKRAKQLSQLESKLKLRLSTKTQAKFEYTPPRYDEVFFKGLEQLDVLAGESISSGEYRVSLPEDIQNSKDSHDPASYPKKP